jgi:exoribonuclease R
MTAGAVGVACRADVERLAFSVIWEVTPEAEVGRQTFACTYITEL